LPAAILGTLGKKTKKKRQGPTLAGILGTNRRCSSGEETPVTIGLISWRWGQSAENSPKRTGKRWPQGKSGEKKKKLDPKFLFIRNGNDTGRRRKDPPEIHKNDDRTGGRLAPPM